MKSEEHYTNRSGWLRAAVLGANDGILSTTSIAIGVAAASTTRSPIILAALAGLVAGALSMAAGEYVSVSSQSDIETSDLEREKKELETMPEEELKELAMIYQNRGLDPKLSLQVAEQLTKYNALEAHAKDELGINEFSKPKPLQAALASGASFISGGILPFLVALFAPVSSMVYLLYGSATIFLAISGGVAAKAGGSNVTKGIIRICFWGTIAMGITALVGYLFGVKTA
ncbi:VIT1/CCC1 transporter family protein [Mucilaginibacter xinganensis]|uniref:Putative Fe2+/Mn2+ transporter, VIT1/CCC1 family n=1 Tax=Mucilaginibacter xinganensis TaxID=1234841 RepID=A0A223NXR8_9SPHI|nr:VIT family protein [Mucilaginibacter xinganensis]ASU34679.1 putative Fe2+/Mn2+ transporter, VIT1/CCC1 family [Mucilaginibacter xinganensis]